VLIIKLTTKSGSRRRLTGRGEPKARGKRLPLYLSAEVLASLAGREPEEMIILSPEKRVLPNREEPKATNPARRGAAPKNGPTCPSVINLPISTQKECRHVKY